MVLLRCQINAPLKIVYLHSLDTHIQFHIYNVFQQLRFRISEAHRMLSMYVGQWEYICLYYYRGLPYKVRYSLYCDFLVQ